MHTFTTTRQSTFQARTQVNQHQYRFPGIPHLSSLLSPLSPHNFVSLTQTRPSTNCTASATTTTTITTRVNFHPNYGHYHLRHRYCCIGSWLHHQHQCQFPQWSPHRYDNKESTAPQRCYNITEIKKKVRQLFIPLRCAPSLLCTCVGKVIEEQV